MNDLAAVAIARLTLIVGLALLASGILLGLLNVGAAAGGATAHCGSAFHSIGYQPTSSSDPLTIGGTPPNANSQAAALCGVKRGDRRTLAIVLIVTGALALFGSQFVSPSPGAEDDPE